MHRWLFPIPPALVFTNEYYVNYAKTIENAGADSICIKDMAALLTPYETYELVKEN